VRCQTFVPSDVEAEKTLDPATAAELERGGFRIIPSPDPLGGGQASLIDWKTVPSKAAPIRVKTDVYFGALSESFSILVYKQDNRTGTIVVSDDRFGA